MSRSVSTRLRPWQNPVFPNTERELYVSFVRYNLFNMAMATNLPSGRKHLKSQLKGPALVDYYDSYGTGSQIKEGKKSGYYDRERLRKLRNSWMRTLNDRGPPPKGQGKSKKK